MEAWYALHTKPHAETRVFRTLVSRGFDSYLPLLVAHKGSPPEPLFPAYLFVRCDMQVIGLINLQWIPGLRRILAFGGRPAIVPDDAIELIRTKLAEIQAQGGLPRHPFQTGDPVVIDQGPLRGMQGIFQGPMRQAERVQILIHFLGQVNRAEIPVEALRAVSSEDGAGLRRIRGTRGHGRRIQGHSSETRRPGERSDEGPA